MSKSFCQIDDEVHIQYPEFRKGLAEEEKAVFATEEQFALSRQAEADIKEWLKSINPD